MKQRKFWARKLASLLVICIAVASLAACGAKKIDRIGTYVPENPDDPNILIPSMTFEQDELVLHLTNVGISNMVCEYEFKDGQILLEDTITINEVTIPKAISYVEIDENTFELNDVRYIVSE